MRSLTALLLMIAVSTTACFSTSPEPEPTQQGSVSGVVITQDEVATAGLPNCEGLVDNLGASAEVVVPLVNEDDVGVVFDDDRAVCRDQVSTLYDLGLISIADLEAITRALNVGSGDPIPARQKAGSGDPIPAFDNDDMDGLKDKGTPGGGSTR